MLNSTQQWDEFYTKTNLTHEPSSFAQWVVGQLYILESANQLPSNHILDIGCGNGRDSWFLCRHAYRVTGIDSSSAAIREATCILNQPSTLNFECADMFSNEGLDLIKESDITYCRFVLHTLSSIQKVMLFSTLRPGSLFFAETRVKDKETDYGEAQNPYIYKQGDKRRFIVSADELRFSLETYMHMYAVQLGRFSPTETENPLLLRTFGYVRPKATTKAMA